MEQNIEWPVKWDDMFPYSENNPIISFWNGVFTERPNLKMYARDIQHTFHSAS